MIPNLDKEGLLPLGIHNCTLEELEKTFCQNYRRKILYNKLCELIKILKNIGCPAIYIDGSFCTSKLMPGDIDVLWDEGSGTNFLYEKQNAPEIFKKEFIKNKYEIDLFPANVTENSSGKQFLAFFQFTKDGNAKGILKIDLF